MHARRGKARVGALLLGAVALLTCVSPAAVAADDIAWMYDPDAVVEIHLGDISAEELDALELEPDEYVKGTFELTVDGVSKGPQLADVGIRLKGGNGSGRPVKTGKSGFKVRFDEFVDDQYFFGIKRLTLNNMIQDPSMVHETLSYELFHALDLPASRTGYAFIALNGESYGLFLNLETLDEVSLPQWFETTGHLYEADAPKTDVRPGEAETFEVDEGDDEDFSDLEALIAAVNDEEGDWSDNVKPVADLERLADQWAVERYIAHWDGYAGLPGTFRPNNYYLHSDAAGVFQMMPWGTDQTWERDDTWFEGSSGGLMFNKCLEDDDCLALYRQGLAKVHCAVPGLDHRTHVAELAAMLQPYQEEEDEARRESSPGEIAEEIASVEQFAELRAQQLQGHLAQLGMLGDATGPCPDEEQKPSPAVVEPPAANPPLVGPPLPPKRLRAGPVSVQGRWLKVGISAPAAGQVRIAAEMPGQGGARICGARKEVGTARLVQVSCRLTLAVQQARELRGLKARLRVAFRAQAGAFESLARTIGLPRL